MVFYGHYLKKTVFLNLQFNIINNIFSDEENMNENEATLDSQKRTLEIL